MGYIFNDTMYKFTVNNDGSITFETDDGIIYNDRVMSEEGAAKIKKYRTGTEIRLQGAVIGLYKENGEQLLGNDGEQIKLTTGENGEIGIPSLEYGIYQYKELEAPEGYVLNSTMYKFTVNNDGTITFVENEDGVNSNGIIYNDRVMSEEGATKIRKYRTGTTTPLEGAVIGLFN